MGYKGSGPVNPANDGNRATLHTLLQQVARRAPVASAAAHRGSWRRRRLNPEAVREEVGLCARQPELRVGDCESVRVLVCGRGWIVASGSTMGGSCVTSISVRS